MEYEMELKTYQGRSMTDALTQVKDDLGKDAVILHTRTLKRGGVYGIGGKTIVEITARVDSSPSCQTDTPPARPAPAPRVAPAVDQRSAPQTSRSQEPPATMRAES